MSLQQTLALEERLLLAAPDPAAQAVLDVVVVRSPRRRTLALHVSGDGRIEARAPLHLPAREIEQFVHAHRAWLGRKVAEFASRPRWAPTWREGGEWFRDGECLRLAPAAVRRPERRDGQLLLPARVLADPVAARRRVLAWHKAETAAALEARVAALFARHCPDDVLRGVEFRWMRATWGTCTGRRLPAGNRQALVRLNLWLGAVPPRLADAVILHELAHVAHMHHGPAFYRRLDRMDPAREAHDRELRDWAARLFPVALR